jgi:pSer/pThr/pTyr-binding forkhead associated (FHA) protein
MGDPEAPAIAEAERRGDPYLAWADRHDPTQVLSLPENWDKVTIGRGPSCDVGLPWDGEVSRVHAELVKIGDDWAVVDDGLSRNGTFVNGERIEGRRRLISGDELRCGETTLAYRAPFAADDSTRVAQRPPSAD